MAREAIMSLALHFLSKETPHVMFLTIGQFSHGGYSGGEQMGNSNIWPRIIQKNLNFNLQFFSKQFVGFF